MHSARLAISISCLLLCGSVFAAPDLSRFYRPIAPWSGQMILPTVDQRAADGSVPFLVYSSPQRDLVGTVLRLAWDGSTSENAWFDQARPDVVFDQKARELGERFGCRFPTALDGWRRVSPLESLPANRGEGTIEVVLANPVLRNGVLYVTREPVQMNGTRVCLARFEGPADGNRRRIRHFNPRTGFFTGPEEVVTVLPAMGKPGVPPQTSTDAIERSPSNAQGWYLYGRDARGGFLVESIEPRQVTMAWAPCAVSGREPIKQYVSHQHFEYFMQPGAVRVSVFEPRKDQEPNVSGAGMTAYASKVWPVGTRALLIHLFGWRKFADGPAGTEDSLSEAFDLVTGHFSFGVAEVVADPFTGEPRWDIEYKQVYGHNREEIVSGSMKWHAYMGNLQRGWMYSIPVSDTIVRIPELDSYDIDGTVVDPLQGLLRQLDRMMSLYRVGGGTGCAIIRPDISCVQDSHCALYAGLCALVDNLARRPDVVRWRAAKGPDDEEVQRFARLEGLAKDVERSILSNGIVQANWKDFVRSPLGTRNPSKIQSFINTLVSLNTVFPRAAHDNLLHVAADHDYPMWNILTVQAGGTMPGVIPLKPTSLRIK